MTLNIQTPAFRSDLHRYFASRPEIFNAAKAGTNTQADSNPFRKEITSAQADAAVAAVGRAGSAAGKFMSAGLKHVGNASPNPSAGGKAAPASAVCITSGYLIRVLTLMRLLFLCRSTIPYHQPMLSRIFVGTLDAIDSWATWRFFRDFGDVLWWFVGRSHSGTTRCQAT